MQKIEENQTYKNDPKAKTKAQTMASQRLIDAMQRLGYGDIFSDNAGAAREGQIRPGQLGNYIYRNGRWEIYNER